MSRMILIACWLPVLLLGTSRAVAQQRGERPPAFVSPEVSPERKITFRLHAPKAEAVRLSTSDLPGAGFGGVEMKKGENGVWEASVGPVPGGAYRYSFSVDGVSVLDPRNTATSESNSNLWSLATVAGDERFDVKDVPHGAVAEVRYRSKSLDRNRRLHVYTPPGYERGSETLPVLYLLHGAMDCDNSWSTVGEAGLILDNLIAAGKAKPMVVVMPMGHTGPFAFGGGGGSSFEKQMDEFVQDFQQDIRPLIEQRYRVSPERKDRAIAGLSMGGAQTLSIALADLDQYSQIGVFSSGVFGIDRGDAAAAWEKKYEKWLGDAEAKKGLRLVWFATGKDDFLVGTTRATVELLKKKGFDPTYRETDGGHTWLNWREYLHEFAPQLFRDGA
jgi:enterochelin esterase family protein